MDWIGKRVSKDETHMDRLKSIAIFSIIEGAILYSSFAFLKHFQSEGKNKLTNVTAGINFSVRDENLHSEAGAWLFKTYLKELKRSFESESVSVPDLYEEIYETANIIYEHEAIIINKIFEKGDIQGITDTNLKLFVKHRIDLCLQNLGLMPLFNIDEDKDVISSWFYKNINSSKLTDFFYKQGSEYNRNWNESKFLWKV